MSEESQRARHKRETESRRKLERERDGGGRGQHNSFQGISTHTSLNVYPVALKQGCVMRYVRMCAMTSFILWRNIDRQHLISFIKLTVKKL